MDPLNHCHKAPVPEWSQQSETGTDTHEHLIRRISELEQQIETYESLLSELPELFERKFQQRLEPLMERYRLLARAQQMLGEPALPLIEEPSQPLSDIPIPFLERWRNRKNSHERQSERNAA